jgi:hypothetical protein
MIREKKKKGKGKKCYVLVGLAMFILVSGCAQLQPTKAPDDPFAYGAYKTISTAVAIVDVVDSVFYNLRSQKQVSDEAWAKYEVIANKVIDKISLAAKTVAKYKRGEISLDNADILVKELDSALKELEDYYRAQIPADQQKPLIR